MAAKDQPRAIEILKRGGMDLLRWLAFYPYAQYEHRILLRRVPGLLCRGGHRLVVAAENRHQK
jgi:hypothetical protein